MGRHLSSVCLIALIGATVLAPSNAHAQPASAPAAQPTGSELAAARQWFIQALALEKKDDWAAALEKFEKVAQIKMTPQVRFHIALCHENMGRLVDAINGFELATQEAQYVGDKARDVAKNAPLRAAALRERVGHVTLTLSGRRTVSQIWLDNSPVSEAMFGSEIPVDPGEHTVQVRRDDEVVWRKSFNVEAKQHEALEVEVDDPEVVSPPDEPPPGSNTVVGEDESKRIPAYVVGGVGVVALATAGVLWGLRESGLAAVEANCQGPNPFQKCRREDSGTFEQAFRYDIASKVTLGVGAAALTTGVVLFFVLAPDAGVAAQTDDDDGEPASASVTILPLLSPNYAGIGLQGTF